MRDISDTLHFMYRTNNISDLRHPLPFAFEQCTLLSKNQLIIGYSIQRKYSTKVGFVSKKNDDILKCAKHTDTVSFYFWSMQAVLFFQS